MIRILRGPRAAAKGRLPADALVLAPSADPLVPWGGARALLPQLRRRLGDAAVEEALAPVRGPLSLVFRNLTQELDEAERAARAQAAAHGLSLLSHNVSLTGVLATAFAKVLGPLVQRAAVPLVAPDGGRLDVETIAVVRALVVGASPPDLHFVIDPAVAPAERLWRRSYDLVEAHLALFEARDDAVVEALAADDAAAAAPPESEPLGTPLAVDPLDDDLERRAARALAAAVDQPPRPQGGTPSVPRDVAALALDAVRAAFASFGFTAALQLGLALAERGASQLARAERAELHSLIALSAYNRQVESAGDLELAALLERHFLAALEDEERPAQKSHLYYRLAINTGRRQGALEEGLRYADLAVETARDPRVPADLGAFLEAWARNGRAYVYVRLRRFADAAADCEEGLRLLAAQARVAGIADRELRWSRLVLADNRAELASRGGDRAAAARWQAELARLEQELAGGPRASPWRWTALLRAEHRLSAASAKAELGLAAARDALDPLGEDAYAAILGDLRYRAGDARGALAHLQHALVLRRRVASPADVLATLVGSGLAAARAGLADEAKGAFARALESPACDRDAVRAELVAAAGWAVALAGDGDRAEALVNEAIELASACGERNALLRVARAAGEACLLLGRSADAQQAFAGALEIAETHAEVPVAPADLFPVLLGLYRAGGDREPLVAALRLAEPALADGDAWWLLAPLLAGFAAPGALPRDEADRAALARVAELAAERADCEPLASQLRAALATPT